MKQLENIIVLHGGTSAERAISLKSGASVLRSLKKSFPVQSHILDSEELPAWLDRERHIVFPVLHGAFGEDGSLQALLERESIEFVGSGSEASALCMDKFSSKLKAQAIGVSVVDGLPLDAKCVPLADTIINQLGDDLVLKPRGSGSSDGLCFITNRSSLGLALSKIEKGDWLLERRLQGREFTVGVLGGSALEIVEIQCEDGRFDFSAKYESSKTVYQCPAQVDKDLVHKLKGQAEAIFDAFGCRDFARIDFIVEANTPYFLEVNTLPGMTEKSLLPKSAAAQGLVYDELCRKMLHFALNRFSDTTVPS